VAQLLAAEPKRVDQEDRAGFTPLHRAASNGHAEVVSLLLDHGASPDGAEARRSMTPLFCAVSAGHADVLHALLKAGARVNSPLDHFTPLCVAAADGNIELVRMLVDHDADVNANAFDPETEEGQLLSFLHGTFIHEISNLEKYGTDMFGPPLHWAAYCGHREVAKFLLDRGAKRSARGRYGRTAAEWAAERGHRELLELLRGGP
jgi:ankyrin repeat protein